MRSNPYPPPEDGRPKKGDPDPTYEGKEAAFKVDPKYLEDEEKTPE